MKESKELDVLKKYYWKPCNNNKDSESSDSISLNMIGGTFIMLAAAISLSILLVIIQALSQKTFKKAKNINLNKNTARH